MRALVCCLAMLYPAFAWADTGYPAPECDAATRRGCIARMIAVDPEHVARFGQHVAEARLQPVETSGRPLCIPPRFFELWKADAREQAERYCGLPAHSLDPVGRYFTCALGDVETSCRRPDIGVALEGGGSKSAPFSLGVLAGLQRSGVLDRVEIVGSTSGGSYAAYYYFARILDSYLDPAAANTPQRRWFTDCMPSMYRALMPGTIANASEIRWCREASGERYVPLEPDNNFYRQVPYQYQVKVGQDLFAPGQTLQLRGTEWYDGDWIGTGGLVAYLLTAQLASVPPHWLLHALFDMHGNFSPTRETYRAGIERAYGHSYASWYRSLANDGAYAFLGEDGYRTGTRYQRTWNLGDLATVYRSARSNCPKGRICNFPLWILSTSSSPGRPANFWIRPQPRDMQRFEFELGPHGQGSGLLGFLNEPPRNFNLRDAVGVSAAFLDDQQRAFQSSWWVQFIASSGIFALNLEWGTNVANFNVGDPKRDWYQVVPFPLYWLPVFQGLRAPYVRLSDGGNVDNLGVISLLRRGVRNIVVAASTDDVDGSYPSLCKLKNELDLERSTGQPVYQLHVPALDRFEQVCTRFLDRQEIAVWGEPAVRKLFCTRLGLGGEDCGQAWTDRRTYRKRPKGYDLWDWPYPVVEGCVVRRDANRDDATGPDSCVAARREDREISRLLIIKPAISYKAVQAQMSNDQIASCHWGNDDITIGRDSGVPDGMNLPCVTLAFLNNNAVPYEKCREHHTFPQDDFIKMTLNSSYTLFGAYYDLGRHMAGQIVACENTSLCARFPRVGTIPACGAATN